MYIGFINSTHGKLLLVRRVQEDSIIPGVSFKGNWELPGGAMEEMDNPGYGYAILTAFRKAAEKTGIVTRFTPQMAPCHMTFFKGPRGYDLAGVIPHRIDTEPTKGETMWVSFHELENLAGEFISETKAKAKNLPEAKGLVSGWGKRMHCMALAAMTHSPNGFWHDAEDRLKEIAKSWQ